MKKTIDRLPNGRRPFVSVPAVLVALFALAGGVTGLVTGCAGSASRPAASPNTGRSALTFTVHWPAPQSSRVIPAGAKSLRFTVHAGEPDFETKVAERLVARPENAPATTEVTLDNLPTKSKLRVTITAYPALDGGGVAQAFSSQEITTGEISSTVEASITLDSTVANVVVNPAGVSTVVGSGVQVTATAYDAEGNVVLTAPEAWTWSSDEPATAGVVATGNPVNIGGGAIGSATVTATHSESGKTVSLSVSVGDNGLPPGCRGGSQLYGDFCGRDENGTMKFWNCETRQCEYLLPK